MADPCPDCGLDRELVGLRHNCKPRASAPSVSHTAETDVANDVANSTYRNRDAARRRAYMRAYVAKRRKSVFCDFGTQGDGI